MTPCRVLPRGKMYTCLAEFEANIRVTTSRNYLIKIDTLQKRLAKRSLDTRCQDVERIMDIRDRF